VWSLHDRLEEHISESNCAQEIESFKAHGQRTRVLGRPVRDDPDFDVEVICGARRLFVARLLNMKLHLELRDLSDREAIVEMHLDNCSRLAISPYERGVAYLRWLRRGHFQSQEDIASSLKISPSQVSRLLKLACLPSAIVNAFGNAVDIRESWAGKLTEVMQDPNRKLPTIRAARTLAADSLHHRPHEIYRRLLAAAAPTAPGDRKTIHVCRDQVIKSADGAPLFRVRHQQDSIALLLPLDKTSAETLTEIQDAVALILSASAKRVVTRIPERGNLRGASAQPVELG
jgi:ParB family chromosome partitioning protein